MMTIDIIFFINYYIFSNNRTISLRIALSKITVKLKLTMLHSLTKTGNVDYSLNYLLKKK